MEIHTETITMKQMYEYEGVKNFTLVTHHISGMSDMCQWHI